MGGDPRHAAGRGVRLLLGWGRAMRGRGRAGSPVMSKLQLQASLGMGNLARRPVESLAWKKCVIAPPYASGNVRSAKANAQVWLFMHLRDSHSFSPLSVGAVVGGEAGDGFG